MASLDDLATAAGVLSDPDVLYAAAVKQIQATPDARLDFSALSHEIMARAEGVLKANAGAIASEVGNVVGGALFGGGGGGGSSGLLSEISGEVAGFAEAVAKEVADVIPIVGSVVAAITAVTDIVSAQEAAYKAAFLEPVKAFLARPLSYSGQGTTLVPSDIFGFDPAYVPRPAPSGGVAIAGRLAGGYPFMPSNPLGAFLAALTEDGQGDWCHINPDAQFCDERENGVDLSMGGAIFGGNLHRAPAEWNPPDYLLGQVMPIWRAAGVLAGTMGAPITPQRRVAYKLLRRAIGSRNADQGLVLWPIYFDMFVADWKRMGSLYAIGMLTTVWAKIHGDVKTWPKSIAEQGWTTTDPTALDSYAIQNVERAGGLPISIGQVRPFVDAIASMAGAWDVHKPVIPIAPALKTTTAVRKIAAASNVSFRTSPFTTTRTAAATVTRVRPDFGKRPGLGAVAAWSAGGLAVGGALLYAAWRKGLIAI